jgi:hypothetical protein
VNGRGLSLSRTEARHLAEHLRAGHFGWCPACEQIARLLDKAAAEHARPVRKSEAELLLLELLGDARSIPAIRAYEAAASRQISPKTMFRAAVRLHMRSQRVGGSTGYWEWRRTPGTPRPEPMEKTAQ